MLDGSSALVDNELSGAEGSSLSLETSARGSVPRGQCPVPLSEVSWTQSMVLVPVSRGGPAGRRATAQPPPCPYPLSFSLETACSCLRVFVVLGPMLPAAKDVGQKVVLGALGASVCRWALSAPHAEDFQSLGKTAAGCWGRPREEARRCEFPPSMSPLGWGVSTFAQEGGTLRVGSGPESFILLKGFSASGEAAKLKDIYIAGW